MEERMTNSLLLDFYGPLLTERQRLCYELHHESDLSLGEIATELGISRQAVHDTMQRATQLMASYEEKLHLVVHYLERQSTIESIKAEVMKDSMDREVVLQLLAHMEG